MHTDQNTDQRRLQAEDSRTVGAVLRHRQVLPQRGQGIFRRHTTGPEPECSTGPRRPPPPPVTSDNLLLEPASAARAPNTTLRLESMPKPRERNRVEMFPKRPDPENSPPVRLVSNASMPPPRGFGRKTTHRERPGILQPQISSPSPSSYARPIELQASQPPQRLDAGKEMKRMSSKWFGMSSRQNKRDDSRTNGDEISSVSDEKDDFMPLSVTQPTEKNSGAVFAVGPKLSGPVVAG